MSWLSQLRERARILKNDVVALALAARDPRTPFFVKLLVIAIVAYALSPIDLIPDFIPVLGLLDDLILIPLAISFVLRFVPSAVIVDARARAPRVSQRLKWMALAGALIVIALWGLVLWAALRSFSASV